MSGVADPLFGHGIDCHVVDDLLAERKARGVGVLLLDFRELLGEGAAVVRRSNRLMLGDVNEERTARDTDWRKHRKRIVSISGIPNSHRVRTAEAER